MLATPVGRLEAHDGAAAVLLHVAAVQDHRPKLLTAPLNARLRTGQRNARPVGDLLLAEAVEIGQLDRLPVRLGQLFDHPRQALREPLDGPSHSAVVLGGGRGIHVGDVGVGTDGTARGSGQ